MKRIPGSLRLWPLEPRERRRRQARLVGSPRTHLAAFAGAFGLALAVWLTEGDTRPTGGAPTLWEHDLEDLVAITYRSETSRLTIAPREIDGHSLLWAHESRAESPSSAGEGAAPRLAQRTEDAGFPLGASGREVARALARLQPVRELPPIGAADAFAYGFGPRNASLTIDFGAGANRLLIGARVPAGEERYAALLPPAGLESDERADELAGARLVVLPRSLMTPLTIGEGALRLRVLHEFAPDRVAHATLEVSGSEARAERDDAGGWSAAEGGDIGWSEVVAERLELLAIAGFAAPPQPDSLRLLVRASYHDEEGTRLGWVELFAERQGVGYWVATELTGVPAVAEPTLAGRVEAALPAS